MVVVIFWVLGLHDIWLYEFQPITGVCWNDCDATWVTPARVTRTKLVHIMVRIS